MSPSSTNPDRRTFLGQLAATSAAGLTLPALVTSALGEEPLRGALAPSPLSTLSSPWDLSWLDHLAPARHKAVFDAMSIANGLAFGQVDLYLKNYHEIYGTAESEMKPVLVIRHEAVPMILNDAFWQKYQLGQKLRLTDPSTGRTTVRNPFAAPGATPDPDTTTLSQLIARGAIVLGCNTALMSVGSLMAQQTAQHADAVQAEARSSVLPGVILVPSGIFGVLRAQEAGCGYLRV
jgi:intracellular sulfur oxidation DsrE/DsrF family protein